ncbi:cobaltochelatase subunit CobN, partial [Devosia sp. ZW T5_3]|uniref:cobaltochelatase subunit CobN n=1 Tax=Devosia sp. ZW T5_3 TaxID=3378085 RepID=UPI003853001D
MHLLSAQAGAIQQEGEAIDLNQHPGAYIFASAADSELAMLAAAADRAGESELRLANTLRLSNNLSVDLWLEKTVGHARLVVLRLIGGAAYFQYGVDELTALCANRKIPLALIPGDANPDPILQSRSTIHPDDWTRLHNLFIAGGPDNADTILKAFNLLAVPALPSPLVGEGARRADEGALLTDLQPTPFPRFGLWHPSLGITDESALRSIHAHPPGGPSPYQGEARRGYSDARAFIPILFYRAALEGAGTATITALIAELERQNLAPVPLLVSSLKEAPCVRFMQNALAAFPPATILNLTGFALGLDSLDAKSNPFSGTDAPVIQLIQSGRPQAQWLADSQGLSSKDLAMFLVMPEVDGRIGGLIIGHKADAVWHETCQVPLSAYAPDPSGITRAVTLAANWSHLRTTPRAHRKVAIVLANYPIRDGRLANGVGYDAPQSTVEILRALEAAGYTLNQSPSPLRGGVRGGGAAPSTTQIPWSGGPGHNNTRLSRAPKNISRSRELRSNQTPLERKLWPLLRAAKSQGWHFRRQVSIGPYFADFASHDPKLVIEIDGESHYGPGAEQYDAGRTAFLERAGYRVARFTNSDIHGNIEGVWQALQQLLTSFSTPTPNPSPQGGGGQLSAAPDFTTPSHPSPLRGGNEGGGSAASAYPKSSEQLITLL